jgi:hypothetical protein
MHKAGHTSLSTGVREIDRGSEGLAFVMGRLFEPLVECRRAYGRCDRTNCTRITALLTYMTRNFAEQEMLMEGAAYPYLDAHRRDHQKMALKLRAMRAADVCADRDRAAVQAVVGKWLKHHHSGCDTPLGKWALTRRVCDPG